MSLSATTFGPGPGGVAAGRLMPLAEMTAPLPGQTDVLVIGGGLAGTMLAYDLAAAGIDVVLLERGELNREASGTNAGSVHLQIAIHQLTSPDTSDAAERLTEETRLAVESFGIWHELDLDTDRGMALHEIGGLMLAETPAEVALLYEKQRLEERAGLETHVVEGDDLHALAPYLSERVLAATYCPAEGHVDPLTAVPLLATQARRRGAQIRIQATVEAISLRRGGAPFEVGTSAGTIRAGRVVNAAGGWADEIAHLVGQRLPMTRMSLHVNVTEARPPLVTHLVQHIGRRLTLKQSTSGTFIIGGGWPSREQRPPVRSTTLWESAAGNAAVAVDVIPALRDVRLLRTWAGVIGWTHDVSPLLGESHEVPGFYTCVVGSSGYTMTPVFARMLAHHLVSPADAAPIPASFSPDRPAVRPPLEV